MIASSSSISSRRTGHRVRPITRVLELDILFTSAIVMIILAGVVFTSDVKTLRIDLDPTSQPWTLLLLICGNPSRCFPSFAVRFLVTSGIFWFTFSCNSSTVVPRSAPRRLTSRCLHGPPHTACVKVVDIMSSAFASLWVAFLVCFRHSS